MSAALIQEKPIVKRRRSTAARPVSRPHVRAATRSKAKAKARSVWIALSIEFVLIFSTVYAASSLVGHCMMESARRENLVAAERTRKVRLEVARLRDEVSRLVQTKEIDGWAKSRGYLPLDGSSVNPSIESFHVARR